MYLPGLPSIARDLHAAHGQAELSLTSYFVGNTLGQLIYGPVSDRIGRRPPLLFGLVLFIIGGLACSASPTLGFLIAARLVQGLGGAASQVIGSAVIRDLYSGYEAARLQALRMLIIAVSPILAPIIGAAIIAAGPWRWIFWISAGLGVAGLLMILLFLPETRPAEARKGTRLSASFSVYPRLALDRNFVALAAIGGLMQGAFLAYLAGSSFVFISMNHASPALYSLLFGVNACGFIGMAQFTPQLMRRFGAERLIATGTGMMSTGALLVLIAALTGHATIPILAPPLFFGITGVGLVFGPAVILALREHGAIAGAASALIGFMQGCLGAGGAALVSIFSNGTAAPMAGVMSVFALIAFITAISVLRSHLRAPQPPVGG